MSARRSTGTRKGRAPRAAAGVARFLILFGVVIGAGHLLLSTPAIERAVVDPWTDLNVRAAVLIAAPLGIGAESDAREVTAEGARLVVSKGCDGLGALLLLGATILAFPASRRQRLIGLLIGTVLLFLANAVRLASLLWVASRWPDRLDFFHIDVWQPLMVLIAFSLFLGWGWLTAPGVPRTAHDG